MLDTFGFPTPQGANYQEFYGGGTTRDWIKPRGASMVRMLLIGAGKGGVGGATAGLNGTGGGSGAITQWIGPAIFIPDELRISIGAGSAGTTGNTATSNGGATSIIWQGPSASAGYTLLSANGGTTAAAAAFTNNYFGASGILTAIAGLARVSGNVSASTTSFLSPGADGSNGVTTAGSNVACNYGYPTLSGGAGTTGGNGADGFFLTQPIMIGTGGAGGAAGIEGAGCTVRCRTGGTGRYWRYWRVLVQYWTAGHWTVL
jgi:hypothetical protein